MITAIKYITIAILLLLAELVYFSIADHFNIIDKPNERSSHTRIVLRGGGIIFLIGVWIWAIWQWFGMPDQVGHDGYPWFLVAVTLAAGVSFIDDVHSLPDSVRLVVQFVAMGLMFYQLDMIHASLWWAVILALIVCVGATNIYNFMDGINGITAGYSLAVLVPLLLLNEMPGQAGHDVITAGHDASGFIETSFLVVTILSVLVFSYFNFRPKNKAKCFAGDVGSVGIAFILLFLIGSLIMKTGDITWLVFLIVYGVDGCCTILHRIMLHEHLGEAHRKHAYQIMANELGMSHVAVSLIYMGIQLVISLGMVYLIPNTVLAHWIYLVVVGAVLVAVYVLFMKKYYHLHEEYLKSLQAK